MRTDLLHLALLRPAAVDRGFGSSDGFDGLSCFTAKNSLCGLFAMWVFCFVQAEYLSLVEELSKYTFKLLDNVRGRDELEILLNKTGKESEEKFELLGRLNMAVNYEQLAVSIKPCQSNFNL